MANYFYASKYHLIYLMRIPLESHRGLIKVGDTTIDALTPNLANNSTELNAAANKRIKEYTQTAGINYELLHTELAIYRDDEGVKGFDDHAVHDVLTRSGIKKHFFSEDISADEWFECDLATAKNAITAVKEGRKSLLPSETSNSQDPIIFRPEQREAIDKTLRQFRRGKQMLWNAKMRFGKTLSALQMVKEYGNFRRILILTHRPVVDAGWYEDFKKIYYDTDEYAYGSKTNGETFESLERRASRKECRYVYFASMQDLRGSELVGGKFDKNNEIFSAAWDLVIVDEAHEGTQTTLGKAVIDELTKDKPAKLLQLSGTPFNLLDDFKEEEIYTWDYVMEQRAKAEWDLTHPGDHNPYADLPRLNIYTYDLGRLLNEYVDEDIAFNFREFFRTNNNGEFVHKNHVEKFLNLLTKTDEESMYPFANQRYRDIFRHTLWMVPGVKSAKALSAMLRNHPVFGMFEIVNVAGDGDEEEANEEALRKVNNAIGPDPDNTRTITLSCGRLTTGVSVKPWTGVLMLSGSFNTAASAYMQTIFRVQTPATINGRVKEDCYVFDFAPDRTLKVLAETAKISRKAGKQSNSDRQQLGEFLNFCPIISIEGSQMKKLDENHMLQQLKRVYVERVVQHGFEDSYLYQDNELSKLTDIELQDFKELKGIIGQTKAMAKTNEVDINRQGLTNEEYAEKEKLEKKPKRELTEAEKARLEELKKKKKVKEDAISILRGISIRMPLMIYGAKVENEDEELTIDNFTQLVDAQSWEEFMPKGVTKQRFNAFKKYYDPDIFTAAAKRIRQMARAADKLGIEERIERIAAIFATFRNPDKETVLTPWRVVNMHMSDCLGGYTFYNEDFSETIEEPRFVDRGDVTADVFAPDSPLLEINSKSGLYPLYLAYNIYRARLRNEMFSPETLEEHQAIWDKAVAENIFVICKTPMAKRITERTLLGFRKGMTNMWAPDDLINKIKNQPELFIKKVHDLVGKDVKIKAIVGNPPYQDMGGSGGTNDAPIYQEFCMIASRVKPCYISLVIPSRWFAAGRENLLGDFRSKMLKSGNISKLTAYNNSRDLFSNVEIKGGVCYFLENLNYTGDCEYTLVNGESTQRDTISLDSFDVLIREPKLAKIVSKVSTQLVLGVDTIISADTPFGIPTKPTNNAKEKFSVSETISASHNTALFVIENLKRKILFISKAAIKKNAQDIDKHKVFIHEVGGSGNDSRILGVPEYASPNSVCSQSYLYAKFDSEEEAKNFIKYIRTKFLRILVSAIKITQHATSRVYRYVPVQDFTEYSDIDWSKSIKEIDTQLYAKYHLSDEEITFIESMIKPI